MRAKWRARALTMVVTLAACASAMAQNAIQSINSSQQGGADVIRVELSQPLTAVPAGFAIQTPPRIAIDLPGVTNGLGKTGIEINQGNLRSVSVAEAGERTRLVLNLKKAANYRAELQGRILLVLLDSGAAPEASVPAAAPTATVATSTGAAAGTAPADGSVHFAPSLNRNPLALKDIDFRRGTDGAGRVVVQLPNNQVGVDIRQQGKLLVVDFLRSTLPETLRRRFDVTDFGTPVQSVTTTQNGDRVRMTVESTGNWEHSAYQSDTEFVLEVRAQKVDPNKLTQGPGYAGEKLSLNFQNIEVRALLQVIADFTNFNVVTSDTVTGNVTLRLKDVPWDQALDIILQAKGLGLRKSGNVILIAPKDELNAKEKVELEARAQIASLEPLRTQAFQLNYAKAADVAVGLTGQQAAGGAGGAGGGGGATGNSRILSTRGSVIYEQRTNQLFVNDTPTKLQEVQDMIARIDIPVRQVLIESRIVIADSEFGRSLGVKLGGSDLRGIRGGVPGYDTVGNTRVAIGGNYNAVGGTTLQTAGGVNYSDTNFVNLPAISEGGFNPATFALSLFGAGANRFLNLEISALEADGKGKVVSSPRIVTSDQTKATIKQGTRIPYQQATSSGATSISFVDATLMLEVTPQITPEGNVIMDVVVNNDTVGTVFQGVPSINTKSVKTQVLIENGGTVVIGGIFVQTDRDDVSKVPFLGDVPYLGNLFKTRTRSSDKTEMLIFLTPKVVTDRSAAR
ncbi:MAG: type IV pilus secretin PilQ [Pseudomonadota bacterium]|nr:type IV pilus secretin PilQ [Pseudomonadota bacterium]